MAFDPHKNFAYSTVATAPSPATSGTSLVVAAGQGVLFPTPPFNATVWPTGTQPLSTNSEIVRVTSISTDTLTITRTQESTSARSIIIGDQIAATMTVKTFTDIEIFGGAATNSVATSQTTASTTFVDLATAGPAVTVTIGGNGLAIVIVSANTFQGASTDTTYMGFALSGANTVAANTTNAFAFQPANAAGASIKGSYIILLTGLTAGSTTFTAKYRSGSGNTGTWSSREISVIPL